MTVIHGEILQAGEASGCVLVLDEPLSFWGGLDPASGVILDSHHPQKGQSIAGKLLVMLSSKGSAGTPGGVAENIRAGTGPIGIILAAGDVNIAVGVMVAEELYGAEIPVIRVSAIDFGLFDSGQKVRIDRDGKIHLLL